MPTKTDQKTQLAKKYAEGRVELQKMRSDLKQLEARKQELKTQIARKELLEKKLHREIDVALKSGGMLLGDLPDQPNTKRFDAGRAYVQAVESGNKNLAAELFKNHKTEIFALTRK